MPKPKLNWREKTLFLTPALLVAALLLYQFRGDKMNLAQRHLAGATAIDCGVGHMSTLENNTSSSTRSEVDACAVAAFKSNKPYRVRYDNTIDDAPDGPEMESSGSVRTPKGQVYFFYYRYASSWWNWNWWKWEREHDFQQAICPEPVISQRVSGIGKPIYQTVVGCGTCAKMNSVDSASCIIHP